MKSYQEHSLRQKDRNNYVSAVIMNKLTIKEKTQRLTKYFLTNLILDFVCKIAAIYCYKIENWETGHILI